MSQKPGRPCRVRNEPASARIWAWLTPTERADLGSIAVAQGEPIAVVIREAVNVYVADFRDRAVFVTDNSIGHSHST